MKKENVSDQYPSKIKKYDMNGDLVEPHKPANNVVSIKTGEKIQPKAKAVPEKSPQTNNQDTMYIFQHLLNDEQRTRVQNKIHNKGLAFGEEATDKFRQAVEEELKNKVEEE
jgi:hypothetical protein